MCADRSQAAIAVREATKRGFDTAPVVARRLRVAIFIENDIIYRHFVKSGAFRGLAQQADVTFVFATREPANKRLTVVPDAAEVGAPMDNLPIEPKRVFLWRRLVQVTRMIWRPDIETRRMRAATAYLVGPRAAKYYSVLALPGIYSLFCWWTRRQIDRLPSRMMELVRKLTPDVLIHPTVFDGYFVNDFVLVGRRLGIPTLAIMNSWDNPSTKRAVADKPDWVLVWGPQTQAHAVRYMGIDSKRVIAFGAAQFDVYAGPPRLTREAFCRDYGIDPAKRILLYAGSSKGADEFQHLCMIEEAIDRGDLVNVAVVYRPHPWGEGGYKGERLLDHPWRHVFIEQSMRGYLEAVGSGSKKQIYLADYATTHDVLSSIDALVSPLSTIILEAALHGKPVLCFIPEQKEGSSLGLQARLPHFEDMYNCPAVLMADGEDMLIPRLRELVARVGDVRFAHDLRVASAHFVTPFDEPFSERIVELVSDIAEGRLQENR